MNARQETIEAVIGIVTIIAVFLVIGFMPDFVS